MIEYSEAVLARARQLRRSHGIEVDKEHPAIWWISSINNDNRYRVQVGFGPSARTVEWITCTCQHGLVVGAGQSGCYHAAAVLMVLQERFRDSRENE